jgi:uncharacterized membrane protein YkoI
VQIFLPRQVLGALCFLLLAFLQSSEALALHAANQSLTHLDLSSFRSIAKDTLGIVSTGNLKRAKSRIKDLETDWDRAEARLRPRSPEQWRKIDKAIDAALQQLRADSPQPASAKDALQNLLAELDRPNESPARNAESAVSAKLSIADIIVILEKLRSAESILDVSFQLNDGQPAYAVRTYANGKVWDGLIDGITGMAIGDGTVTDESALDDEDTAELAALKHANVTLRQAVATAQNANDGRALNAGLEQVRGRAVWEILFQDAKKRQQMHIDPITGKIL